MHTARGLLVVIVGGSIAFVACRAQTDKSSPRVKVAWRILGDTSRGRHSCSGAAGIAALNEWFESFNAADSIGLAKASAASGPEHFVFSTGRFTSSEAFFVTHSLSGLVAYARTRARQHERMTIQEVKFNGWRDGALQFGPIYFLRVADDLGPKPRPGIGKGGYRCGQGLAVLNLGPRPDFDPGPAK